MTQAQIGSVGHHGAGVDGTLPLTAVTARGRIARNRRPGRSAPATDAELAPSKAVGGRPDELRGLYKLAGNLDEVIDGLPLEWLAALRALMTET